MFPICIVLLAALGSATSDAVEVSTSLGDIRGVKLQSRLGEDFYAFRGIRYGQPPVGELRFQKPYPVDPWKPKVYDATDDGPMCPQTVRNSSEYSEDCLRLNVYSKNLDTKGLKPVIIYLHPGGFYGFSGQSKNNAGPQLLMDRDIVLVTINYRLGTLGFLSTGTTHAPGNTAMKDQVVAFKWVQDHIDRFGGDPKSVTLLGYSAGGTSIGLHMVSPMSKGLFHRAIAMSGPPIELGNYGTNQLHLAKRQAQLVKCPTENINDMVKCFKKVPVADFVSTFDKMFEFGYNPMLNWMPVVEEDFGQERFLTEEPLRSYLGGRIRRVPLIIGMTKDEFVRIPYWTLKNANMTQQLNEDWERVAPIMLKYERNTPRSKEISATLRKEYLGSEPLSATGPFEPLGKLYSDAIIGFPVHRFAHLAARYVPVFYYRFSYKGRFSDFKYPGDTAYGSVHHDDLLYLLHIPRLAPLFKKTDPENTMVERLTRMWTKFATDGNPNNRSDEYLKDLAWPHLNLKIENFLEIGQELEVKNGLFLERFAIWEKLFPIDWSGCQFENKTKDVDYPEQRCSYDENE